MRRSDSWLVSYGHDAVKLFDEILMKKRKLDVPLVILVAAICRRGLSWDLEDSTVVTIDGIDEFAHPLKCL